METSDENARTVVYDSCFARVGLLGNPSDGFEGQVMSFLISNFAATVRIEEFIMSDEQRQEIANIEPQTPETFSQLIKYNCDEDGAKLMRATVKVGLSGSSAIIVATFRALLSFYGLSLEILGVETKDFPQIILDIELKELGIMAGLQDRVIQVYGGLVFMDFTQKTGKGENEYTHLDPASLPHMYLVYDTNTGSDSGKVHSNVKERYNNGDADVIKGMAAIANLASQGRRLLAKIKTTNSNNSKNSTNTNSSTSNSKSSCNSADIAPDPDCLQQTGADPDVVALGELMAKNFAMRRKLYGDGVTGALNIEVAELLAAFDCEGEEKEEDKEEEVKVKGRDKERDKEKEGGEDRGMRSSSKDGLSSFLPPISASGSNTSLNKMTTSSISRNTSTNSLSSVLSSSAVNPALIFRRHGLSCKFTGSGGAFVCLRSDGMGWMAEEKEKELSALLKELGFEVARIKIPTDQ